MEQELLTIKDFAEAVGVSVQSIYKKIGKPNNPIQRYLIVVEGVKYIRREAIEFLYSPTGTQTPAPPLAEPRAEATQGQTAEQQRTDRLLTIMEQQLEELRKQLAEKDKTITAQAEQIGSLLERLKEDSHLLKQQTQLTAINTVKYMALEEQRQQEQEQPIEEQKKKRFRIFGRK